MGGEYVEGSIWFYAPNKGTPVAWAFFFAVSCAVHFWQCVHYKSWKFTGLFPWAALVFTAGYIMREVGAFHYRNVDVFISSVCLVYAAPPVYELANYIILGRILYYVPYHSAIHPGRVITTFGGLSAVVEALNGNGAAYSANANLPESKQDVGRGLIKAALIIQLIIQASFILLAGSFHRRCYKANLLPKNLKAVLYTLYFSSMLIIIRTIYRTVEYMSFPNVRVQGLDPKSISPIIRYEWFFWVFEGMLMIINSVLLNVRHPARYLPRNNKIYLAQDGVTEIEGPGYENKRHFVLTILDPFDLVGLAKGRKRNERFWEGQQEMGVPAKTVQSG